MCKSVDQPVVDPPSITAPTLDEIKKALPPAVWKKSLPRSLLCMAFDMSVLFGMMYAFVQYLSNPFESLMVHYGLTFVYWNLAGFYMWCIFVVGHDCGHGSFSDYWLVNAVCGLLTHGSIMVPFFPWARSHHLHHLNHNHVHNDYSFPWIIPEELEQQSLMNKIFAKTALVRMLFVPIGWHAYILNGWDGCHFTTLFGGRMWKGTTKLDAFKCHVSTAAVVAWAYAYYIVLGKDLQLLATVYAMPNMIFGMWLLTVTYLQHHAPEVTLFDDSSWTYKAGAFETIDRTYGWVVDLLHHRISDCHVVHHIFFKNIPHYRLREATDALERLMQERGNTGAYKKVDTWDFFPRLLSYMYNYGFFVHEVHSKGAATRKLSTEAVAEIKVKAA